MAGRKSKNTVYVNIEAVLALMKRKDLSQTMLAEILGVSRGTICRVLKGSRGAGGGLILSFHHEFPELKIEDFFAEEPF